jgi:hypothetical protein
MGLFDSVGSAVGAVINPVGTIANKVLPGSGYLVNPGGQLTEDIARGGVGNIGGALPGGGLAGVQPVRPAGPIIAQPTLAEKKEQWEALRGQREADIARGEERGQKLFGAGSLGRLDDTRYQAGIERSLVDRLNQAQMGLQAPEYQAQREQAMLGMQQGQQEQLRALRGLQARSGVRGGLAGAQQAQLLNQAQAARANVERDLMVQNIAQKQAAQQSLENLLQSQQQAKTAQQQFNLQQAQREKMGQLTSMMGEAQLGGAERGAVSQEMIGRAMQQAVQNQLGSGGAMGKK